MTRNPAPKKAAKKSARESTGKLTIREIEERDGAYTWQTYLVQGWREGGKHKRKKFSKREEAEAFMARKQVELLNQSVSLHNVLTRLPADSVKEAEAAFTRLGTRYTLSDAVEYFLSHFAEPEERKEMPEAVRAFLDDRERSGIRHRSLVQLRATLEAFTAWLTVDHLPDTFRPDVRRVSAKLANGTRPTLREILANLPQPIRAEVRRLAGDHDAPSDAPPPAKFLAALPAAVRKQVEAVAADMAETRQPSARALAAALGESVKALPVPAVHEVTPDDVRRYLRALRAKDGKAPAARKTWNNYRADLHAFFAWAVDKQRRWTAENPAGDVEKFKDSRGIPSALSVGQAQSLLDYVASYEEGKMARFFALALFSGMRTGPGGELHKLASHPERAKFIDLARGVIHVQPEISKTGQYRQIIIRPNLAAWLNAFPGDILPANHDRMAKHIRAKFSLGHDVLRHTFFSMHVAAFKSVGEAALEGGNTEAIVKKHYLNLSAYREGKAFWKITPPAAGESRVVAFA